MNEREAYERLKADSYTVDYAGFLQRQSDIEVLWQALTAQAQEIAELREEAERLQQAFNAAPACELPAAFRVTWEIDIDGVDSHEEAARSALGIQRDPESTATVFRVRRRGEWQPVEVDLQACGQENRVKVGP